MDRSRDLAGAVAPDGRRQPLAVLGTALLALALLIGSTLTSCSAAHDPASGVAASMQAMDPGADQPPADAAQAWAARPDFVSVSQDTKEAYEFALYHPDVLRWMPCYCGCEAMKHRSNLDCYLRPKVGGAATTFEQHASYCDLCVRITLLAKQMNLEGASLGAIRQAVDQTFGAAGPGTLTDLPPA